MKSAKEESTHDPWGSLACAKQLGLTGVPRLIRRALYFFLLGMAIYLLSWSTVRRALVPCPFEL